MKPVFGSVSGPGLFATTEMPPVQDEPFQTEGGVQTLQAGGLLAPFAQALLGGALKLRQERLQLRAILVGDQALQRALQRPRSIPRLVAHMHQIRRRIIGQLQRDVPFGQPPATSQVTALLASL